jgi:hypothetical protein
VTEWSIQLLNECPSAALGEATNNAHGKRHLCAVGAWNTIGEVDADIIVVRLQQQHAQVLELFLPAGQKRHFAEAQVQQAFLPAGDERQQHAKQRVVAVGWGSRSRS